MAIPHILSASTFLFMLFILYTGISWATFTDLGSSLQVHLSNMLKKSSQNLDFSQMDQQPIWDPD